MSKPRFGIGLVVGALAGLAAGLLTAPKSGKETRADIKRKANEVSKEAKHKVDQARRKAGEMVDEAKDRAEDIKERASHVADSARKEFDKDTGTRSSTSAKR